MSKSRPRCAWCKTVLVFASTGRPKVYCSGKCRVAAWRERPRQLTIPA